MMLVAGFGLATASAPAWARASPPAASQPDQGPASDSGAKTQGTKNAKNAKPRPKPSVDRDSPSARPTRRWSFGLQGVGMQVPVLDSPLARIDPRFVGRSVTMIGVGLQGRFTPVHLLSLEVGTWSGSVRYRDGDRASVAHDVVLTDIGTVLWVWSSQAGRFGIDGGGGAGFNLARYDLQSGEGRQRWASGFVRSGLDVEVLTRRVSFSFAVRFFGVMTDRRSVANRGEVLAGASGEAERAPVATFQTYVVGSAGVAYRF